MPPSPAEPRQRPRIVFVFGSNLAGRHGKGAALDAAREWGAERGRGEGPTGRAFALPTKDENMQPLPLEEISEYVRRFVCYANAHPHNLFVLTPIGTGLAGQSRRDVWAMLQRHGIPGNVVLSASWVSPEVRFGVADA